jgi:hypothetical protein
VYLDLDNCGISISVRKPVWIRLDEVAHSPPCIQLWLCLPSTQIKKLTLHGTSCLLECHKLCHEFSCDSQRFKGMENRPAGVMIAYMEINWGPSLIMEVLINCITNTIFLARLSNLVKKLRGLSPRANYTDLATAACRRS